MLVGVAALTLGLKVWVAVSAAAQDGVEPSHLLEQSLIAADFEPGEILQDTDPSILTAERGDCVLAIAQISPMGWHRHLFDRLREPGERHFFVFRGEVSETQPVWLTAGSMLQMRLMRYLGLHAPEEPVWTVLASSQCAGQSLPWAEGQKIGATSPEIARLGSA